MSGGFAAAERAVQPAGAELRLALRLEVQVALVALDDVYDALTRLEAALQHRGRDERQIVRRSVVLRITAIDRAGESPGRKIEPRGTQLPLVVTVGREGYDGSVPGEHVRHDLVDLAGLAAAALVSERARLAQQRQHQCVTHARQA